MAGSNFLLLHVSICILALTIPDVATASDAGDFALYTFAGRAIERLLTVVVSGCSLYFGYRLFSLTSEHAGKLVASGKAWSFKIAQVGPGVFFALFGSAVLIYALHTGPTWQEISGSGEKRSLSGVVPASTTNAPDANKEALLAINSLIMLGAQGGNAQSSEAQAKIRKINDAIEPLRKNIVDSVLAPGRYNEWAMLNDRRRIDPAGFSRELEADPPRRQRFYEVDALMSNGLP